MSSQQGRREQAAELIRGLVAELMQPDPDLASSIRKALFACQLAGWSEAAAEFGRELAGYQNGDNLPLYRQALAASQEWTPRTLYDAARFIATRQVYGEADAPTPTAFDCYHGIDDVLRFATAGLRIATGNEREIGKSDTHHESLMIIVQSPAFVGLLSGLRNSLFKFASDAYIGLTWGDSLQETMTSYRGIVEERLVAAGLAGPLEAINEGLRSDNPQEWRNVMWACRDLMRDVATYLWRDSNAQYAPLSGDKPWLVTEDRYVNRLGAYLHHKSVTGNVGAFLRTELERIFASIHALNELDSKAHAPVTREEAELVAAGTFFVLGEVCRRTDFQPVDNVDC